MIYFAKIFVFAFILSYIITPLMIILANKLKIVDNPALNKAHKRSTPLLGGVGIYVSLMATLFFLGETGSLGNVVLFTTGMVLLVGILDDKLKISAVVKFIILVILSLLVALNGIVITMFSNAQANIILTILWLVGISSAFNAVDNTDGLCSGLSLSSCILFSIVAIQTGQHKFGALSLILAGAIAGFIPYNFPNAKIFLGNSGSFFIGFILGLLAMLGAWSKDRVIAFTFPLLILFIPIFDICFVVIYRIKSRVTTTLKDVINHSGTDHISHRLIGLGFTRAQTVLFLVILSVSFGLGAIVLRSSNNFLDAFLLFLQAILLFMIIIMLIIIKRQKSDKII